MSNEVSDHGRSTSVGRVLRASLRDFCLRPVAWDQAGGTALSGEETQIQEREAPQTPKGEQFSQEGTVWPGSHASLTFSAYFELQVSNLC